MPGPVQRVVVWGFMASGKTAVGAKLARRLGWSHLDLDEAIVRRERRSIADIFGAEGEAVFRRIEAEVTRELIGKPRTVISPGGGWVANPELPIPLPPGTLTVWLRVEPETVLARVRADRSGVERPLLGTADPAATVRELLARREPLYRSADIIVSTDARSVDDIVDEILAAIRSRPSGSPQAN